MQLVVGKGTRPGHADATERSQLKPGWHRRLARMVGKAGMTASEEKGNRQGATALGSNCFGSNTGLIFTSLK